MARKKVTTTEETIEDAPQEELNYVDDLKDKSIRDVASEESKQEIKEEVKEEVKETPVEETEEVEFDPEAFKAETAKAVKEEIADFLKGDNKEQTKERGSEYAEFVKRIEDSHGRPPNYLEALDFVKDQAKAEIKAEQEEAYKKYQDDVSSRQEAEKTYLENFNKELQDEMTELYTSNKLPKIKNADDPEDYGVQARDALFKTMAEVNTKRVQDGQTPIRSISRIFTGYYKAPSRQPAGEDAMITDSRNSVASNDDEEINYLRDVRGGFKQGFRNLLKR